MMSSRHVINYKAVSVFSRHVTNYKAVNDVFETSYKL